jgi:hypothetical protein
MAISSTDVYFTTVVRNGAIISNVILHRTPRSGGPVVDVVTLPAMTGGEVPDGILLDGNTLYIPQRDPASGISSGNVWVYDLVAMTTQNPSLPSSNARSSGVSFDGSSFYWGVRGNADCTGALMRLAKTALDSSGPAETLVQHLDPPLSVRLSAGNAYVGTEAASFRTPVTEGQLLLWKP